MFMNWKGEKAHKFWGAIALGMGFGEKDSRRYGPGHLAAYILVNMDSGASVLRWFGEINL